MMTEDIAKVVSVKGPWYLSLAIFMHCFLKLGWLLDVLSLIYLQKKYCVDGINQESITFQLISQDVSCHHIFGIVLPLSQVCAHISVHLFPMLLGHGVFWSLLTQQDENIIAVCSGCVLCSRYQRLWLWSQGHSNQYDIGWSAKSKALMLGM